MTLPRQQLPEPTSKDGDDRPREECGIFGIFNCKKAANFVYLGLYSLQHRGQESAGIVSTDGSRFYRHAGMGQVRRIFDRKKIQDLQGKSAIGHNRYSTTGASFLRNAQPICVESHLGVFSLAHNGNLVNAKILRRQLEEQGAIFQTTVDTEVIVHLISRSQSDGTGKQKFVESLANALQNVKGAYSLILLTKDHLYAVRDPNGFRPLVLGKRANGSYVVASETCAFDITDTEYVRDVHCGELIAIDRHGLQSYFPFGKSKESMCVFEHIYFARPDSFIFSRSVYEMRLRLGESLARVQPVAADIVVPIPDSSNAAAIGYAEESKIPLSFALIRSHYIGRTFIEPMQQIRDFGTRLKYNVVRAAVRGKKIVLIDDSIMRGTTARKLTRMLRRAGALEIHLRISAPPTKYPCYYGVDIPTSDELIAANKDLQSMQEYFNVDSLAYLPISETLASLRLPAGGGTSADASGGAQSSNGNGKTGCAHLRFGNGNARNGVHPSAHPETPQPQVHKNWCDACFTGNYPVQKTEGSQGKLFEFETSPFQDID